jgi:hypothetical protein
MLYHNDSLLSENRQYTGRYERKPNIENKLIKIVREEI